MAIPKLQAYALPESRDIPKNKVDWAFEPQRAALLIHDMQDYFVSFWGENCPMMEQVIANIAALRDYCKQHNIPVYYTAQPKEQSDEDRALLNDMWGPGLTRSPEQQQVIAALAPDLLTVTFNGLSKTYRVAGFRQGWMVLNGPKKHAKGYIEGLEMLASMRLCANVPAQHAIQTALGGYQSISEFIIPGGRLYEQRNRAWELINDIPGVSCVKPNGALYMFPKIDAKRFNIHDDQKMVLDFLLQEKVLLVQGTAFNWPWPDHVRIVTLPREDDLEMAISRFGRFLSGYHQL